MEEEKKGNPSCFCLLVLALLGYASWYFFTQFDKKHLSGLIPFMDEANDRNCCNRRRREEKSGYSGRTKYCQCSDQ